MTIVTLPVVFGHISRGWCGCYQRNSPSPTYAMAACHVIETTVTPSISIPSFFFSLSSLILLPPLAYSRHFLSQSLTSIAPTIAKSAFLLNFYHFSPFFLLFSSFLTRPSIKSPSFVPIFFFLHH